MSALQFMAAACLKAYSASKLLLIIAEDVVGTLIAIAEVFSCNPNQDIWIQRFSGTV